MTRRRCGNRSIWAHTFWALMPEGRSISLHWRAKKRLTLADFKDMLFAYPKLGSDVVCMV